MGMQSELRRQLIGDQGIVVRQYLRSRGQQIVLNAASLPQNDFPLAFQISQSGPKQSEPRIANLTRVALSVGSYFSFSLVAVSWSDFAFSVFPSPTYASARLR